MDRRTFLASSFLASLPVSLSANNKPLILKPIPSTHARLPAIGMGTWITFNIGRSPALLASRTEVLKTFFALGGGMVDSSPMYGSAQKVVGEGLATLGYPSGLFSADKIWTQSSAGGVKQFNDMLTLWGVKQIDLVQIHNLVNWRAHLETLRELKSQGKIRYIGITTSHGLRHAEMESIMRSESLDFVQLTYNILYREAEALLLPLALEKNIAVIANRPLDGGNLFNRVQGHVVPAWAREFGCENWAQYFLKFIVSHPAITCAIPATSKVEHMIENMGACYGELPDADHRKAMVAYLDSLA